MPTTTSSTLSVDSATRASSYAAYSFVPLPTQDNVVGQRVPSSMRIGSSHLSSFVLSLLPSHTDRLLRRQGAVAPPRGRDGHRDVARARGPRLRASGHRPRSLARRRAAGPPLQPLPPAAGPRAAEAAGPALLQLPQVRDLRHGGLLGHRATRHPVRTACGEARPRGEAAVAARDSGEEGDGSVRGAGAADLRVPVGEADHQARDAGAGDESREREGRLVHVGVSGRREWQRAGGEADDD